MKRYNTRPGVVLTTVAGQYVLVAAKQLREICPHVTQINDTAAFCWRILEQGSDLDELMEKVSAEYEVEDPEELRQDLLSLLDQKKKKNYLID